jgi:hypothetical protein
MIAVPAREELSEYYQTYLKYLSPGDDLVKLLKEQSMSTPEFLSGIPAAKEIFAYADGKWMLKQVIGHLCDTERILSYRALRISRSDQTPLQGFDENTYMTGANYQHRSLKNISEELAAIRKSTIALFENLSPGMYGLKGTANNARVSVKALLFFIVAHERHHLGIVKERYLS